MNPKLARKITARLAESGQPPERGVSAFNVGTDELLDTLEKEYLETILGEDAGSTFKLVEAQYGGGKTHFLRCLQDVAWKRNFVVSLVQLDQRECPYDDPLLVYRSVVKCLAGPPKSDEEDPEVGLQPFLRNLSFDLRDRFNAMSDPEAERVRWFESFRTSDVESTVFREAVACALTADLNAERETFDLLSGWILGENPPLDRLRGAIGVGERLDRSNAFPMLRSLCQTIRALGFAGTLIMFDEGYRMVSLMSAKKQKEACENLVSVINYCGHARLPGAMFIYAVPPSFRTEVAPRYEALRQRIESRTPLSARSPMSPVVNLEDIALQPQELLERIGQKLLPIVGLARSHEFDRELQMRNLRGLAREAIDQSLDVNSRRIFVKAFAESLIEQAVSGERELAREQVEEIVRDTNDALRGAQTENEY